jgi:hypothetical protein
MRRTATPAHPPKSAEKRAQERGTWFDMYPGRAAINKHRHFRRFRLFLTLRQIGNLERTAHIGRTKVGTPAEADSAFVELRRAEHRPSRVNNSFPTSSTPKPLEFGAQSERQCGGNRDHRLTRRTEAPAPWARLPGRKSKMFWNEQLKNTASHDLACEFGPVRRNEDTSVTLLPSNKR